MKKTKKIKVDELNVKAQKRKNHLLLMKFKSSKVESKKAFKKSKDRQKIKEALKGLY